MPVQTCVKNGKTGKKYGSSGKCYVGKIAESKAKKQGMAIEASKSRTKKKY
jgi:hypothetical protein